MTAEEYAAALDLAGPGATEIQLTGYLEYRAVISAGGWVQILSPRPLSSFDFSQSDAVYLLLTERRRSDELADEVERLKKEVGDERARCLAEIDKLRRNATCGKVKKICSALIDRIRKDTE